MNKHMWQPLLSSFGAEADLYCCEQVSAQYSTTLSSKTTGATRLET